MDQAVNATQVDEYAVGSDVLDNTFQYLAFFKFGDDFAFLLLELSLDKDFVADNNIFVFLIDFNDLEFHGLAHEDIIVADGLDVDL